MSIRLKIEDHPCNLKLPMNSSGISENSVNLGEGSWLEGSKKSAPDRVYGGEACHVKKD
jgi:hypothetical protein